MCWVLVIFSLFVITKGENCPTYPIPVELDLKDPLIANALENLDAMLQREQNALGMPGLICSVTYDQV